MDGRPDELALTADTEDTGLILEQLRAEKRKVLLSEWRIRNWPPVSTFHALYDKLEKRIKDYPLEAKQKDTDGQLPIHLICYCFRDYHYEPPESLIRTMLQAHPGGAFQRDIDGDTPLHIATYCDCSTLLSPSCISLFSKAFTIPNDHGKTAFHESLSGRLACCWSLLHAHPQSASIPFGAGRMRWDFLRNSPVYASIPSDAGRMPLDVLRNSSVYCPEKILLVKLALYYGAVPQVPTGPDRDEVILRFQNYGGANIEIANILPLPEGEENLLLKKLLRTGCPWVLFDFLFTSFPEQRMPVDPQTGEPRRGRSPFEVAVCNLVQRVDHYHEPEQLSIVYALFRDNPMHYLRQIDDGSDHRVQEFREHTRHHRRRRGGEAR